MLEAAKPWLKLEGNAYRCARHGETFKTPGTCAGCMEDPSPALEDDIDEAPDPAPAECDTLEGHERAFTVLARLAERHCLDVDDDKGAAKWAEVAVKARRAAAELTQRRQDEELVRKRERRIAARNRGTH